MKLFNWSYKLIKKVSSGRDSNGAGGGCLAQVIKIFSLSLYNNFQFALCSFNIYYELRNFLFIAGVYLWLKK